MACCRGFSTGCKQKGSLTCHYGHGNENVKEKWLRLAKQHCTCITFFVHFFTVTARLRRALPNFTFYRQRKHTTTNLSYAFYILGYIYLYFKNSTPGEFAYMKHSDRVGIIALKFHRSRSHFLSDVFAAVAVVLS